VTELQHDAPSPEAIRRALQAMADAYNELDPDHFYTVRDPENPKPGAVRLWASKPPSGSAGESGRRGSRPSS
jgi:hypothetical protein